MTLALCLVAYVALSALATLVFYAACVAGGRADDNR
jgi:hypothetical protein